MRLLFILILVAVIYPLSRSSASFVEALSFEQLINASEYIGHTKTISTSSYRARHGIITDVHLQILETAYGNLSAGDSLMISIPGGTVNGVTMRVVGAPHFEVGDESVVFAHQTSTRMTPVGLSQGVLPIQIQNGYRMVVPSSDGLDLVRRNAQGRLVSVMGPIAGRVRLTDVLDMIREISGARP